jgi:hypothetical protein
MQRLEPGDFAVALVAIAGRTCRLKYFERWLGDGLVVGVGEGGQQLSSQVSIFMSTSLLCLGMDERSVI